MDKIGRYEVKKELGRGGMATVFLANDPLMKREVAVKVLPKEFMHDPKFLGRFEREAQTIALLEHAAIVPVYDFGEHEGQPYLVMRYMSGGSLAERIAHKPFSIKKASVVIARLAVALDKAHIQGIVHRDLKPANILFDKDGDAYLADFGIVKLTGDTANLTGTNIVGTPAYMSPEQAGGDLELDGRSDVYSLGIIVFEMLTGDKPFQASTPVKLLVAHLNTPIPDIQKLNEALPAGATEVIQNVLAKDRDDRYQTAGELVQALRALESPLEKKRVSKRKTEKPKPKKKKDPALPSDPQSERATMDTPPPIQPTIPKEQPQKPQRKSMLAWGWGVGVLALFLIVYSAVGGFSSSSPEVATATPQEVDTETPEATVTLTPNPTATPQPQDGDLMISEIDGMEMVYISAGEFTMGSEDGDYKESPVHTVYLDAFWIDKTEVTNTMYRLCVEAGVCDKPSITTYYNDGAYADHPVVYVRWYDAADYCEWTDRRLPNEAEWEKAARGTDGRTYPWGERIDESLANYDGNVGYPILVGSYPKGASPYGLLDMAGNVWEWTLSLYQDYPYDPLDGRNDRFGNGDRVLRGGSWGNLDSSVRAAYRVVFNPGNANDSFGFRCAALVQP